MENVTNGNSVSTIDGRGEAAYNKMLPDFKALPADQLAMIGVDLRSAAMTVMGALPEIRALAAAIQRAEPEVDAAYLDKLELSAYALIYCHIRYLAGEEASNDLLALVEEGAELRERLTKDVAALASRRLLDSKRISQLQGIPGYKNIATDLGLLSVVLRENWPKLQNKCAIDYAEVQRALDIAENIFRTLGLRDQGPTVENSTADIRARAFTYLVNSYDKVRKAVTFLRWDTRDFDRIAPSLYAGRSRKRSGADDDEIETTTPPVVAPPVAPPVAAKSSVAADSSEDSEAGTPDAHPFLK